MLNPLIYTSEQRGQVSHAQLWDREWTYLEKAGDIEDSELLQAKNLGLE